MNKAFPHVLERTVTIRAERDLVFGFFTDPVRWAAWWGAGSTIDARTGGRVFIRYPDGTEAEGEVTEVTAPEQIRFTYGYARGTPMGPGESEVTLRLEVVADGTRLHLRHAFRDPGAMAEHQQGWRYQLSLFGNVVTDEAHAGAAATIDGWFAAWSNPDAAEREAALERLVAADVSMRDRFSLIDGLPDLFEQLKAVHRFMPGMALAREGEVRHCQGIVLADWIARTATGDVRARGTNVFTLTTSGRIQSITGFWSR